jgi:integrase
MHADADYIQKYKGNYRVRIRVPVECRNRLPKPYTGKIEILQSLKTSNPSHAKNLARRPVADFLDMIEAARPVPLRHVIDRLQRVYNDVNLARVNHWLGQPDDPVHQMINVTLAAPAYVSFATIIADWKTENKPGKQAVINGEMVFRHLAAFVGHDDAAKLTDKDIAGFKRDLLAKGKSTATVTKYLAYLKTALKVAKGNLLIAANPCDEVENPRGGSVNSRKGGFSMAEMAAMVAAARQCDNPVIRVPVLIAAYHGAVRGEIVDADKSDFEVVGDMIIFHIREGKTEFRPRRFPLHSCIVPEVKAYLNTIPDGPAFPSITFNERLGTRSHNAATELARPLDQRVCRSQGNQVSRLPAYRENRLSPRRAEARGYPALFDRS